MPQIYKFFQFHTYLSVAKATRIKSSEMVQDYIRYLEEFNTTTRWVNNKKAPKNNFSIVTLSDRLNLLFGVSIGECGLYGTSPMLH